MSRTVFPFIAQDVSSLARALSRELEGADSKPGHVQLLNDVDPVGRLQEFSAFPSAIRRAGPA